MQAIPEVHIQTYNHPPPHPSHEYPAVTVQPATADDERQALVLLANGGRTRLLHSIKVVRRILVGTIVLAGLCEISVSFTFNIAALVSTKKHICVCGC